MDGHFTFNQPLTDEDLCWICGQLLLHWRKDKSTGLCNYCHVDLLNKVVRHKKRARIKGREATLTIAQWAEILRSSKGHCFYCHKHFGYRALVLEHTVSIAKGGGTTAKNCVPACGHCNSDRWSEGR